MIATIHHRLGHQHTTNMHKHRACVGNMRYDIVPVHDYHRTQQHPLWPLLSDLCVHMPKAATIRLTQTTKKQPKNRAKKLNMLNTVVGGSNHRQGGERYIEQATPVHSAQCRTRQVIGKINGP